MKADRLLDSEIADVDGVVEERLGTVSVFNGPEPAIMTLSSKEEEIGAVGKWVNAHVEKGIKPHEIGIFVRTAKEIERASAAVITAGLAYVILDGRNTSRSCLDINHAPCQGA